MERENSALVDPLDHSCINEKMPSSVVIADSIATNHLIFKQHDKVVPSWLGLFRSEDGGNESNTCSVQRESASLRRIQDGKTAQVCINGSDICDARLKSCSI